MESSEVFDQLSEWTVEINRSIAKSNAICLAIFSSDGEILYSNYALNLLSDESPTSKFINPTFEDLLAIESASCLIFDGFLTLGDYDSINTSVVVQIYRKEEKLLMIGGVDAFQLIQQNSQLADLNREIGNLQREVLIKTHFLENALKEVDEYNLELKKEKSTRDKLFSIIAHDLRSPFNGILGFSELLSDSIAPFNCVESQDYLENINVSAKSTLTLLDNLLNWAKSQTGRINFEPEILHLTAVIKRAVDVVYSNAHIKKITINTNQSSEIEVYADKNMLKTVFRNLLSNAIKFTKPGGEIDISTTVTEKYVEVSISDTGVGVDEETRQKLFNVSANVTTTGTADETGSGLGLILCKEFVEKQGGKIWVESELGQGSDFKFTVPINQP